ncbi:hypothetical protein QQG74_06155 [Micromonospora sp. FIMYZ51]|uniref:trypsin-like peptidase domain-containing protein n=1 Tax=Micromonospora sp. FIMYZ51 TaxID=3051832 RepID=UPI00311FACE2
MACGRPAVLLGVLAVVAVTGVPAVAAPTYVRHEPAIAVAAPAAVYLEATYTGYLRDPAGRLISRDPVVVTRRCSGVVVSPEGHAVTTTVCIQPSEEVLLVNALYRHGRELVRQNDLAAEELDGYVGGLLDSSVFTGRSRRSAPEHALVGQPDPAISGNTAAPAIAATVTATLDPVDGNAALVKLARPGLPAVEITAAELSPGVPLLIMGFGREETTDGSERYRLRNRAVEVIGRTGTNRIGVSEQIGPDSRGGPVVNESGRLVALLDTDGSAAGEPIRDLITAATLRRLLEQGNVDARLSEVDRAYRAALGEYYLGRYSQAVTRFDAVLRQDAAHPAALRYRERAQERLVRDGDATENSAEWTLYLVSAAGGAAIIAAIGHLPRLRQRSASGAVADVPDTGELRQSILASPASGADQPAPTPGTAETR